MQTSFQLRGTEVINCMESNGAVRSNNGWKNIRVNGTSPNPLQYGEYGTLLKVGYADTVRYSTVNEDT